MADDEIKEIARILGLSRGDVEQFFKQLEDLESTYGTLGRAMLLRQAEQGTSKWKPLWMGLAAGFGAAYSAAVTQGWELGAQAAIEVAKHMGQALPAPVSMVDILRKNVIPFADKHTMEIETRIRGELVRGILARDDLRTLSNRLVGAGLGTEGTPWKNVYARAQATVRAESSRAYHAALMQSFDPVDWVSGYQVLCFPEGPWPCSQCLPHCGKVYAKNEVPEVPIHVNCRCTLLVVTKRYGAYDIQEGYGEE